MEREGCLFGHPSGDNVNGTTNIIPNMDFDALCEGYRNIMQHIYSPLHYYQRVKTFLREYRAPKIAVPLDFQRLSAFLLQHPIGGARQGVISLLEALIVDTFLPS